MWISISCTNVISGFSISNSDSSAHISRQNFWKNVCIVVHYSKNHQKWQDKYINMTYTYVILVYMYSILYNK